MSPRLHHLALPILATGALALLALGAHAGAGSHLGSTAGLQAWCGGPAIEWPAMQHDVVVAGYGSPVLYWTTDCALKGGK